MVALVTFYNYITSPYPPLHLISAPAENSTWVSIAPNNVQCLTMLNLYLSTTDVDECTRGLDNCDLNAVCQNLIGSYSCRCDTGWMGNGTFCSDMDECTFGSFSCHPRAQCTNTLGSFDCSCPTGYSGNGITCIGKSFKFILPICHYTLCNF